MLTTRRDFMMLAAATPSVAPLVSSSLAIADTSRKIKAVAFDGLAVIDTRPIGARLETTFPGRGTELGAAWRTRQFEYAWLRTMGRQYRDFWQVTEESLAFAAGALNLDLSPAQRDHLMQGFLELRAWPDAAPVLRKLRGVGIKLAFLSNFTATMLDAAVENSGLQDVFDNHLSTDLVQAFKPDPRAYEMALNAFKLQREEIAFAAFAGWDVAGAKWFGYPTYWVNRMTLPVEELGVSADSAGSDLTGLPDFLSA